MCREASESVRERAERDEWIGSRALVLDHTVAVGLLVSKFAEVGLVVGRDPLSVRVGRNYDNQCASDIMDVEQL